MAREGTLKIKIIVLEKYPQCKEAIARGLWKRIGDGPSVNIWKNKWLIGSEKGIVTTRRPTNCHLENVSDLIEEGRWKKETLQQLFSKNEAELIENIPLSLHRKMDRSFLSSSKTSVYTVKSGNEVAKKEDN